jgi:hypothetical protein
VTTQARDCPECGLTNPPSAMRCDCGHSFEAQASRSSVVPSPKPLALPSWTRVAFGMAVFQVLITSFLALSTFSDGTFFTSSSFGLLSIADVVALSGLAFALLHRHLWAAWGLVVYAALDLVVRAAKTGQSAWAVPLVLYLVGAYYLQRAPHISPRLQELRWVRIVIWAVVWIAGNFGIGFLFGMLGLLQDGAPRTEAIALAQLGLFVIWGVCAFSIALYGIPYPFENLLLMVVCSIPLGMVDSVPRSWLAFFDLLSKGVWSLAIGMIAYLLTTRLSRPQTTVLRQRPTS